MRSTLVSVIPSRFVPSLTITRKCTHPRPSQYDLYSSLSSPHNERLVSRSAGSVDLLDAVSRSWDSAACLLTYRMFKDGEVMSPHPRVAMRGLEWVRAQGLDVRCVVLLADGSAMPDTPVVVPMDSTVVWRTASGGFRLVKVLREPIAPEAYGDACRAWYASLAALKIDYLANEWNRVWRLPGSKREVGK